MLFDGYIVKSTRHSQRIRDEREELLPEDARLAAEGRTNGKMNAPDSAGALGDAAKVCGTA